MLYLKTRTHLFSLLLLCLNVFLFLQSFLLPDAADPGRSALLHCKFDMSAELFSRLELGHFPLDEEDSLFQRTDCDYEFRGAPISAEKGSPSLFNFQTSETTWLFREESVRQFLCLPKLPLMRCVTSKFEVSWHCHMWNAVWENNRFLSHFDASISPNVDFPMWIKPYPRTYLTEYMQHITAVPIHHTPIEFPMKCTHVHCRPSVVVSYGRYPDALYHFILGLIIPIIQTVEDLTGTYTSNVEVYISDCWKKHVGKSMIKHGSDKSMTFWRKIASDIDFKCMKDIPEKEVHCFSAVSLGVSHHMNFLMDWDKVKGFGGRSLNHLEEKFPKLQADYLLPRIEHLTNRSFTTTVKSDIFRVGIIVRAKRGILLNSDDLINTFSSDEEFSLEIFKINQIDVEDLIFWLRQLDCLIAFHGDELIYSMFLRPKQSVVVQIMPYGTSPKDVIVEKSPYETLARVSQVHYIEWTVPDGKSTLKAEDVDWSKAHDKPRWDIVNKQNFLLPEDSLRGIVNLAKKIRHREKLQNARYVEKNAS